MLKIGALLIACGLIAACGQEPAAPTAPAAPAAPAAPSAPAAPAAPAAPTAALTRKPAPAGAMAYIIEPSDGARVTSPVRVVFGLKGIGVAPAGVDRNDAGHHHLLVDTGMPDNLALPIPNDEQHRHFGGGQTEVELTLAPGRHTLQMLLGDHLHIPHDPPIASSVVTIEVQ
jgi:nucleoid-associated protein YgaU